MKTWIFALPFLCAASAAMAQEVAVPADTAPVATPAERAAAQASPAATPAEPVALADQAAITESKLAVAAPTPSVQAKPKTSGKTSSKGSSKYRAAQRGPKSLPKGDVRYCLDLKTRAEVIRCSETRQKK